MKTTLSQALKDNGLSFNDIENPSIYTITPDTMVWGRVGPWPLFNGRPILASFPLYGHSGEFLIEFKVTVFPADEFGGARFSITT